jgi:hypothetical protein
LADFQEELPRMRLDHDVAFPPPAVVEIMGDWRWRCRVQLIALEFLSPDCWDCRRTAALAELGLNPLVVNALPPTGGGENRVRVIRSGLVT